jgi:predicted Zn-dependent peptidase
MTHRRLLVPLAAFLFAPMLLAQVADRSHPPVPGPVRPFHLPPVRSFTLASGVPVLLVERHQVPVASVVLAVLGGASADPAGRPGLASMTVEMLDEGAAGKDALAVDDAISFLGAELTASTSWDASLVTLHVPAERLAPALALMADVALRPDFPGKEWDRIRRQKLTEMLSERSEPDIIAARALAREVFGDQHRYGMPVDGTAASVSAIGTADLRSFHSARFQPGGAALFVTGDVTVESVKPLLEAAFGSWKGTVEKAVPVPAPPQVRRRTIWIVDKPDAAQSAIRVGRVGPGRRTPFHAPIEVMNTLLGGLFTSRLNDNLREQHGWSYGAGSRFDFRRTGGLFYALADVQTPATADALREILRELTRIGTPSTGDDVGRARSFLALRYAEQFQTSPQLARKLAETFIYGVPVSELESYLSTVAAVTPAEVAETARREIDPARIAIVVVGDRKVIEKPIRDLSAGEVRIVNVDDVLGPAPKLP